MHYDQPTDEDLLGRKPLTEALSKFLRNICMRYEGTFLLHINGKWGSGKSSLLRLLRIELEKENLSLSLSLSLSLVINAERKTRPYY